MSSSAFHQLHICLSFSASLSFFASPPPLLVPHQSGRLCQALRGRVNELEAELAEQSHLRLQAAGESEFLKAELDDLRRVREDTEKEQRSLTEIESKAGLNAHRCFLVT